MAAVAAMGVGVMEVVVAEEGVVVGAGAVPAAMIGPAQSMFDTHIYTPLCGLGGVKASLFVSIFCGPGVSVGSLLLVLFGLFRWLHTAQPRSSWKIALPPTWSCPTGHSLLFPPRAPCFPQRLMFGCGFSQLTLSLIHI